MKFTRTIYFFYKAIMMCLFAYDKKLHESVIACQSRACIKMPYFATFYFVKIHKCTFGLNHALVVMFC